MTWALWPIGKIIVPAEDAPLNISSAEIGTSISPACFCFVRGCPCCGGTHSRSRPSRGLRPNQAPCGRRCGLPQGALILGEVGAGSLQIWERM